MTSLRPLASVALAAALVLPLAGCGADHPMVAAQQPCNGSVAACDRRLDEVVFPATHNSYAASAEPGWHFANQRYGIARQLDDGIRALLIDVHYGALDPRSGRVHTDLGAEGSDANKVAQQLGPAAVRTARRVAGTIGLRPHSGRPSLYLCHTLCELGAEPLGRELGVVDRFLAGHPRAVLIVVVEPYVPAAAIEAQLRAAGLLDQVTQLPHGRPLPTLGELIDAKTRLVLFAERGGGAFPGYLPAFDYIQDTPYSDAVPSCRLLRGAADNPLLMLNNWVGTFPPVRALNRPIGRAPALRHQISRCASQRGRRPSIVAVDFYDQTDIVAVAQRLNR